MPILALLLAQLLFGVWPVVGKLVLVQMPAAALAGVRILLAGPVLFVLLRAWRTTLDRRERWLVLGLGTVGVSLNQALFAEGLARTTALNGAVLGTLTPVYTIALSVLLGREQASARRMAGLGIALGGALFLVGAERFDLGHERMVGNVLIMVSSLTYSGYLVLTRPLFARHGALHVTAWTFLLAMPSIALWSWPNLQAVPWATLPSETWLAIGWIVLTASLAAYVLNAFALRHVPASTVASFVYLQPLVTGLAQGRLLGTRPGWQVLVAAAVIFAGVALVTSRPKPVAA